MRARLSRKNEQAGGVPLVLLPGGPGLSSATLAGIGDRLTSLALVDPPGTGGLPAEPSYTFDGAVEAMEAAILELGGPVDLLGHSFGGTYAARLLARGKVPVRALVLLATPVSEACFQALGARFASTPPEIAVHATKYQSEPTDANFHAWLKALCALYFSPARRPRGEELLGKDRVSSAAFSQIYADLLARLPTFGLEKAVREFALPKLLIAGDEDGLLPVDMLRAEAGRLGARFTVLAGAGHFAGLDQPEQLNELLREFLASGA